MLILRNTNHDGLEGDSIGLKSGYFTYCDINLGVLTPLLPVLTVLYSLLCVFFSLQFSLHVPNNTNVA